jgi:ribonuclease VapC
MIVDTSALLAILYQEEDAEWFVNAIVTAPICRMSVANFLEAAINIDTQGDPEASRQLDNFIRKAGIEIAIITPEQAQIARQAYQDFGRGRHKAGLNFGDCFAYALARASSEPLLFKGNDFVYTDLMLYPAHSLDDDAIAKS